VIPNESTTHDHKDGEECTGENDTKTVNGYYVVRFESENKNETELVNVRHILVSFEGGKTDEKTGTVTYTDAEKLAAKNTAEALLKSFTEGEATEEAFAALATKNSTDTGSKANGGLYEKVYPGQMVTNFNDWCFDSARKTGDTGIVETEYGYHVMYFVDKAGVTYRDFMIESTLRNNDLTAWENGLVEAAEMTLSNTKYVNTELILSPASSK
jgi:parvulin-like peptidyl-prolyl isomerase